MAITLEVTPKRRVRRSKRLGLSVPVIVHGADASGQSFRELTRTLSLNANGALLCLNSPVQKRQTLFVENQNTRQQEECRVVYVGAPENGACKVGLEFTRAAGGFWEIYFPPLR